MPLQTQVNRMLARWFELSQRGESLSAEALCNEMDVQPTPDLILELQRRMHNSWQGDHEATETPALRGKPKFSADETVFSVTHYDSLRFLAKGGVGEVYQAGDKEFGRDVALKFIQQDKDAHPQTRQHFLLEGEVTARLDHPGVVAVYGLGYTTDGRPFHAMQLIRGETLGDRIEAFHREHEKSADSERSVRFRELLSRFVSVCNTIAYAHNRGILHRDIKPSNIMLGKYGETLVVDWGLAKPIPRDERARASGEASLSPTFADLGLEEDSGIVGTPSYMSPEQSRNEKNLAPATDIYSLGATFYKVLTGQPSVQGNNLSDVLRMVQSGRFRPPREKNRIVPRPLEAICLKAMSLEPGDRYESALDMAADIERWLADEPVAVYREPWTTNLRRWTRRNRLLAQIVVALLLAAVVAVTAWVTSRWNQREILLEQRLKDLSANADVQAALLNNGFRDLVSDVHLLATRPSINGAAMELEEGKFGAGRQSIEAVFHDFLDLNPNYMQVRLIDKKGFEVVRLHRTEPGGEIGKAERLQFKGDRPYFTETMKLKAKEIFLSPIELNVESGEKQWDFPVIRAAVPLYRTKKQAVGIVIINMHFQQLTQLVRKSETKELLVYLTNQKGEFLLHPTPDIAFCFERDLDYDIQSSFPDLEVFLRSEDRQIQLAGQWPRNGILLRPKMAGPAAKTSVNSAVSELLKQHQAQRVEFSADGERAVLNGVDANRAGEMLNHIRKVYGDKMEAHALPPRYRTVSQAVFCRKVFFDRRSPKRFINLVLVLPY